MSVHQGIMPYACDQCDYKCNEKSDIGECARIKGPSISTALFLRLLTDVFPLKSKWMTITMVKKSHFSLASVRHKHKHLGIKRYTCEYCSYRADQRWLLVNHTAKQHGIQLPRVSVAWKIWIVVKVYVHWVKASERESEFVLSFATAQYEYNTEISEDVSESD